jgi:photosystem II stability/assembly factor-like uncharacterized protein
VNKRSSPKQKRIAVLIKVFIGMLVVTGIPVTIYQASQPVTITWESVEGPTGEFVWAVALDPDDADIIYVGTNGGGVYKSTDGGTTWAQKNEGLESWMGLQTGIERALDIQDILISRTQPGVVYVATWGPEGIYRSDNGGENWEPQVVEEPDQNLIGRSGHVRVLTETETGIFAGTDGGIFRLTDPDDIFWQPTGLKSEQVRALLSDPRYPQTLYAATLGQGIYKSEDGGQTWLPKNGGLESEAAQKVNALTFDPAKEDVMYAGTFGDGVYRSLDGGESWEAWSEGLPEGAHLEGAQVWSLRFAEDGTLFAGLRYEGTYKQAESGEWQRANFPYGALALEVDSRTGAIYAGTWGGGLYRDQEGRDESPQDWQSLGLPTDYLRLRAAVFAGPAPPTLYAGTDSDGVYASQDGGQSWERRSQGLEGKSLAVWALAVGPDGRTLYAGTGDGVFFSADGGKQWDPLGKDTQPADSFSVISLVIGKNEGQDVVYAGTRSGLWFFDPNQQEWTGPMPFEPEDIARVPSLLVADGVVYASVWDWGVQKSADLGNTWQRIEMAPRYVETLTLADKTWLQWCGKQFYALTERGLYGSSDGEDWGPLELGLLEAVTVDPLHPQVTYAGITLYPEPDNELDSSLPITSTGILASVSDGRGWEYTHDEKVPPIEGRVTRLVRDPSDPHRIFALAADGGLYRGHVQLPWLGREVVVWWLVGTISIVVFVVAPYSYSNLLRVYGLSHRLAWGLLARFWLLFRVQSQRFQNRLKPMEKLILATTNQPGFGLVEVWGKLDEIGISTSRSRLMMALKDLAGYGLLKEQDGGFRYTTPGLQNVAAVELLPGISPNSCCGPADPSTGTIVSYTPGCGLGERCKGPK